MPDKDTDSPDRPAQDAELTEGGVLVGGPSFAERLEHLAGGFAEIQERFGNRLISSEVLEIQKYLYGRFAVVCHLRMGPAYACYMTTYLRPAQVDPASVVGFDDRVIAKLGNPERGNKHVVLLPVTQVVQVGEEQIPAGLEIVVRFDPVHEKIYDLSQGLAFKSLRNGCLYALRVGAYRERLFLGIGVKGAMNTHPAEIGTSPQIVTNIPDQTWDSVGDQFREVDLKRIAASIRIRGKGDSVRLFFDEALNLPVEISDQFVGPYNLRAACSKEMRGSCNVRSSKKR